MTGFISAIKKRQVSLQVGSVGLLDSGHFALVWFQCSVPVIPGVAGDGEQGRGRAHGIVGIGVVLGGEHPGRNL